MSVYYNFRNYLDKLRINYREINDQIVFPAEVQDGRTLMMLFAEDDDVNSAYLTAFVPCNFRYNLNDGYVLCNKINANSNGPRCAVIDDPSAGNMYGTISVQLQDYLNPHNFDELCQDMLDREIDIINEVIESIE